MEPNAAQPMWKHTLPESLAQATEIDEGTEALKRLLQDVGADPKDRNEATTRFQIIDRLLVECLGYPRLSVKCEPYIEGDYADYMVGQPVLAIWEAKREGITFEIPKRLGRSTVQRLASLAKVSKDSEAAIIQVNNYCLKRGCSVAVATNGHQIIAFVPSDLSLGMTGNAFVIYDLDHLQDSFGRAWQLLSYPALLSHSLGDFLERSAMSRPPEKLSSYVPRYPRAKERTDLQSSLNTIADLLLLNIEKQEELEQSFYKECYVESGGLSQNSTISKSILAARYASLFDEDVDAPDAIPVRASKNKDLFTPELLAEAISSKPIILVGDVGVGKTSFIKHLKYVSAYDEFRRAIYVYVDLAFRGALQDSLRDLVLNSVENTLLNEEEIDIFSDDFVRRVYKKELIRFERSPEGRIKETLPDRYLASEISHLGSLMSNRAEHIKKSVQYLSLEKRKQLIIAIDNADKRSSEVQQDAFIIAQNIASEWKAAVFVSMRPSTYYTSKRAGALSAYQSRVFTISPPRIDQVLSKRLKYALDIAQGKRQLEQIQHVRLNLASIVAILRVIMASITASDDVQRFLENITAGNVRAVIELLAEIIGSPNIDTEGAIRAVATDQEYFIPIHDFWKVALKGEFEYFDPTKARAVNVYSVYTNDKFEHFLAPLILAFLSAEGSHRASEGFVDTVILVTEIQSLGFNIKQCEGAIRHLVNDNLIETSLRVSFEEDDAGLYGSLPERVRINSVGAYYLDYWIATFSYLDAMAVDMQIFDPVFKGDIVPDIRSVKLEDRVIRALKVRDYLSSVWVEMGLNVHYFSWEAACQQQNWSFERAKGAVSKIGYRS